MLFTQLLPVQALKLNITKPFFRKVVPAETGFVVGIKLNSSDFNIERHEPTEGLAIVEALDVSTNL